MDANPNPAAQTVPKGKIFPAIVAGLIGLGVIVSCAAPAPQAAPRVSTTPTPVLALQPFAAPTVRTGGPTVASKSFNPGQHPVKRNVKLEHPNPNAQMDALLLPTDVPGSAPPGKGISKIVTMIIEPQVKINGAEVTTFSPPLTITVDFDSQDSAGAPHGPDGKPKLILFTAWKQGNAWKWEKLATTVDCSDKECTRGTLTARISNLHPGDPVGEGFD